MQRISFSGADWLAIHCHVANCLPAANRWDLKYRVCIRANPKIKRKKKEKSIENIQYPCGIHPPRGIPCKVNTQTVCEPFLEGVRKTEVIGTLYIKSLSFSLTNKLLKLLSDRHCGGRKKGSWIPQRWDSSGVALDTLQFSSFRKKTIQMTAAPWLNRSVRQWGPFVLIVFWWPRVSGRRLKSFWLSCKRLSEQFQAEIIQTFIQTFSGLYQPNGYLPIQN